MADNKQRVAVLGASPKSDKYSNKAVRFLLEHEHHVIPVHPAVETIEGLAVSRRLADIDDKVDTLKNERGQPSKVENGHLLYCYPL
jgi:predicted CoA-binding protein